MIIRVLAYFLFASFSTELCAGNDSIAPLDLAGRYDRELEWFSSGLYVYDSNGEAVEITKGRAASSIVGGEITFKLYTKRATTSGQELKTEDTTSLENSGFDSSKPTYMITHGWRNNEDSPSCVLIRDAYLANTDSNIIVIDWSSYSMSIYYIDVTYKVKEVGETVKKFIKWLYQNGLKADDLTLVGHSLGAHVMGLAGYQLKPEVNNIVGLDPALPMFNFAGHGEALTKRDAKHVQIIHTNAGILGYACSHGHSDFFPNGGVQQPGCCNETFACFACSHARAVDYFAESISETFDGIECDIYAEHETDVCADNAKIARMGGLNLESVSNGRYYLRTNSIKPFSEINDPSTAPDNSLATRYHSSLFGLDIPSLHTLIEQFQDFLVSEYLKIVLQDLGSYRKYLSSQDVERLKKMDTSSFLVSQVCVWRPVIKLASALYRQIKTTSFRMGVTFKDMLIPNYFGPVP